MGQAAPGPEAAAARRTLYRRTPGSRLRTLTVGSEEYVSIYGGEAVLSGGRVVGRLRSCGYGFTVKKNLAYSYLPVELKPDANVEVEVFGKLVPATVVADSVLSRDAAGAR